METETETTLPQVTTPCLKMDTAVDTDQSFLGINVQYVARVI